MKTIGLLGGMSWESTTSYYQVINREVRRQLGGLHSAKIILYSVDFEEIEKLQHSGDWQQTAKILGSAAKSVEAGGADFLLICTNTMHKVAKDVENEISIPLLHIADATAEALIKEGIQTVGLLGTKFTMEQDFYKGRLTNKYGLKVLIPSDTQMQQVHDVIYNELCKGEIKASSKSTYLNIINELHSHGAEAIILGCTEIALLVQQIDTQIPLYDTAEIHALNAVTLALKSID